jgi:hypothetical protein
MVNGAGVAELVLSRHLQDNSGGIGGKVDRYHQGTRLAAASIRPGGIRSRGLGHGRASSIGVERRW